MNDEMQKRPPLETKDIDDAVDLDYEKIKDTILIFSSEDERLKFLGEILSNESSRSILRLLIEKEMTLMQIAKQTSLNPTLVIHHLKKLLQSDVVTITKTVANKKGRPMKFYRARPILMISSKDIRDNIHKNKSLINVIKKISRFAAIGLAGMSAWMVTSTGTILDPLQSAYKYPRPTIPPYMTPIEPHSLVFLQGDLAIPVISAGIVVIVGLVVNHIMSRQRRKSSQLFE
jgi:DNA-binding transcriptional ArsR family regulator